MKKSDENRKINCKLRKLYNEKTAEFLSVWEGEPQNRINEFGIIDVENYDTDNGILFIGKETNGWGVLGEETFLSWINDIITGKQKTKRPQIWYNLGRWAKFITNPTVDKQKLIREKSESLAGLRKIAFTNVNKVGGGNVSGSKFWKLANKKEVQNFLKEEIGIFNPKVIVLCGFTRKDIGIENMSDKRVIIEMQHPSARNISKLNMLSRLETQIKEVGWSGCCE